MSENLKTGSHRIYIVGKVRITSPLHIGSGEMVPKPDRFDTDSPIKLNSDGESYLPATAIGGLLRGTAENLITALQGWELKHLRSLFGDVDEAGKQSVSRLRLHDAKIDESRWRGLDLRDGVGIDRQRASARPHALYNYEIVPAGSKFSLLMELRDGNEKDRQLLALTLEALNQLPSAIGAKGNSGLGALKLEMDKVITLDLTDRETLFKFLCQDAEFKPEKESGEDWETWRKSNLPQSTALKTDKQPPAWRIPQAITFTYRLKVKDPLLIRGREAPESALQDYQQRYKNEGNPERQKEISVGDDMRGIDATWLGSGSNPANLRKDDNQPDFVKWEPVIPGSSLRGVFRSHCERILRTLWWHYAGEDWEKYRKVVIASDALLNPKDTSENDYHLRSSGFEIQEKVSNLWQNRTSGEAIADFVWRNSDLGERMWGSSQWKSRVLVSEATIPAEQKDKWKELLFQNVAINRFTGGASEQRLFNALAVTHATFEGSITVFGNELWMIGLIALLFKDFTDGLIRAGSGKTRGRGSFEGWLKNVEVKTLPGSEIAKTCKVDLPDSYQVWITVNADSEKLEEFPQNIDGWLKELLEEGVKQLNKKVQAYAKEEGGDVRNNSSEEG